MNRKHILVFVLLILFAVMQTSMFPHMRIMNNIPNFVLVFVCVMAYFRGSNEGFVMGLVGGLMLDFLVGTRIGFYGLLFMFTGMITGLFPRKNVRDNFFLVLLITMSVIFPFELIAYWLRKIFVFFSTGMKSFTVETGEFLLRKILPEMVYNFIVFVPLYFIGKKIDVFLNKDKSIIDT